MKGKSKWKENKQRPQKKHTEPWKFYRKLTPAEEQMIEQHLDEPAGLTREELLTKDQATGLWLCTDLDIIWPSAVQDGPLCPSG
jgi:hypothetical protein